MNPKKIFTKTAFIFLLILVSNVKITLAQEALSKLDNSVKNNVSSSVNSANVGVTDHELIEKLLKRIDELENRVKELETNQAKPNQPQEPVKENVESAIQAPTPQNATQEQTPDIVNTNLPQGLPNLQIRGYADLQYSARDQDTPFFPFSRNSSFALGQFDLFITSRLSKKANVLAELVFEADEKNSIGIEIERLLFQYSMSPYLNLGVGRYHTAIGFYNTAFHHGAWFQTAVGRPFLFQFEDKGGILPIHNVGLTTNGEIPSGRLGLKYIAEFGNGRASRSLTDEPVQNVVDENNGKSVNLAIIATPDYIPGLQAGFSFYYDKLSPSKSPRIRENIFSTHVVYQTLSFEFLNEAVLIQHKLEGLNKTLNLPGFYSQISRQFGRFRPYFRYQYVNLSKDDPILGDVGRRNGPSFGIRYNFTEFAAFKIQYDRTDRPHRKSLNEIIAQIAFTF